MLLDRSGICMGESCQSVDYHLLSLVLSLMSGLRNLAKYIVSNLNPHYHVSAVDELG